MYIMKTFDGGQAAALYYIALGNDEPMINHKQRTAVAALIENAGSGDTDARAALETLSRKPSLHPFLKEMIWDYRK